MTRATEHDTMGQATPIDDGMDREEKNGETATGSPNKSGEQHHSAVKGGQESRPLEASDENEEGLESSGTVLDSDPKRLRSRRRRRRRGGRSAPTGLKEGAGAEKEALSETTSVALPPAESAAPEAQPVSENTPPVLVINRSISGFKNLKFPGLNQELARREIKHMIQTWLEQSGAEKVVLGLSGGLDSAVTAGLLVEAIGVRSVSLVHFLESERGSQERAGADLIARILRCPLEVRPLKTYSVSEGHDHESSTQSGARKSRLSRERMAALYEWAEAKSALVAGAINKTKLQLGTGIPFGDLAYQFNPVGDLYRSQVLEIARAIRVPRLVMEKASQMTPKQLLPTATRELELSWKEIDFYLYQLLDQKLSLAHLQRLGANEEKLLWVYRRIRESAGQRRQPQVVEMAAAYSPQAHDLNN